MGTGLVWASQLSEAYGPCLIEPKRRAIFRRCDSMRVSLPRNRASKPTIRWSDAALSMAVASYCARVFFDFNQEDLGQR